MKLIAALGPSNTFSEIAAQMYVARSVPDGQIELYPTIKKVFTSIGRKCEIGILPIENMLDGYIPQVLDLLLHSRLTIIDELLVPVHFSFAANCKTIEEVKRVYVQFVSQGQCSDFIEQFPQGVEIVTTESNGESLERLRAGDFDEGAVIPTHALNAYTFPLIINNINDYLENKTRFIVIAEQEQAFCDDLRYKTSIAILEGTDRPGMLSDMLSAFARRNINLLSIISRPTKESMGKYHFFIDIEGYARDKLIQEALADVRKCGFVKLIGSYPKAEQLITSKDTIDKKKIPVSPWIHELQQQPVVHVVKGDDPYANTIKALSNIDCTPVKGKRVLLKPNLGRIGPPESGIVTNPQVIAAAIDFFRDAGASFCAVGESPITGIDVMEAFRVSGVEEVCKQRNCPIIDMDIRKPVDMVLPNAVALEKVSVCADVFDFDILVSVPVMKMHMHTGVTLSIKNMKGCLWSRSKVYLHMLPPVPYCDDKPLNVAVADMASILYPHIALIDGTTGMEGLGPSAGSPKPLGVIVVSTNALAADTVACEIMGVAPNSIPHLRILHERGTGSIDTSQINIKPDHWRSYISQFAALPQNLAIEYPDVTILDENSCSACQSTLLMFLKRYGSDLKEYFPDTTVTAAIGKGHKEIPANALCIGNCTRKFRDHTIYVSGCPPVASSILKAIKKYKDGE
jgi:prephenate dehydratase